MRALKLASLAAALLSLAPIAGAEANTTSFGDGKFTFTLSNAPTTAPTNAVAYTIPTSVAVGAYGTNTVAVQVDNVALTRVISQGYAATTGSSLGVLSGGGTAPYTSFTESFGGNYLSINREGAVTSQLYVYYGMRNAGNTAWVASPQKSTSLLWGSVGAGDIVSLTQGPSTIVTLSGSQILAAAASLGFTGNNNSYYVTINAVGANTFYEAKYYNNTQGTSFEVAPLWYSVSTAPTDALVANAPVVTPPVVEPPAIEPPVGAPAPVLGATPVGGALGLAILGMMGLARRRRAERTSAVPA